jgi:hypothetical protein
VSNAFIFQAGVVCFGLALLGAFLTVLEFKRIARRHAAVSAPLPAAVKHDQGPASD